MFHGWSYTNLLLSCYLINFLLYIFNRIYYFNKSGIKIISANVKCELTKMTYTHNYLICFKISDANFWGMPNSFIMCFSCIYVWPACFTISSDVFLGRDVVMVLNHTLSIFHLLILQHCYTIRNIIKSSVFRISNFLILSIHLFPVGHTLL